MWFYVAGILNPAVLAPDIDSSVLVGFPAAQHYLGFDGHPSTIQVRALKGAPTGSETETSAASPQPEQPKNEDQLMRRGSIFSWAAQGSDLTCR